MESVRGERLVEAAEHPAVESRRGPDPDSLAIHSRLALVFGVGTSGVLIRVWRKARRRSGIGPTSRHDRVVVRPTSRVPCGIKKGAGGCRSSTGRVQPDSVLLRHGRIPRLSLPDLAHPVRGRGDDGWRRSSLPGRRLLPRRRIPCRAVFRRDATAHRIPRPTDAFLYTQFLFMEEAGGP